MFRQVVTELVQSGKVSINSRYEFLEEEKQPGDFLFFILHRTLPYAHSLSAG